MTSFWRNWLSVWCGGVVLFGAVLAAAGFEAGTGPARVLVTAMYSRAPFAFDEPIRFAIGLMGALTIALGMLVFAGARAADELGNHGAPVWRLIVQTVLVWYVIDSAISCANGFVLNAVSNTLIVLLLLAPILATGVLRPALRPLAA